MLRPASPFITCPGLRDGTLAPAGELALGRRRSIQDRVEAALVTARRVAALDSDNPRSWLEQGVRGRASQAQLEMQAPGLLGLVLLQGRRLRAQVSKLYSEVFQAWRRGLALARSQRNHYFIAYFAFSW